jgi:hypothetical protein
MFSKMKTNFKKSVGYGKYSSLSKNVAGTLNKILNRNGFGEGNDTN